MRSLFVYGTLQHPPVLERLLGRVPVSEPARLEGYRPARLAGRPYPGLVSAPGAAAAGRRLTIEEPELEILDRFEGDQYERIDVVVHAAHGEVAASAWRLRPELEHLTLEEDWELERFLAHDAERFVGGSRRGRHHPGGRA